MIVLAVLGVVGFTGGLCLFISSVLPAPERVARPVRRPALPEWQRHQAWAASAGAVVAFAVARWPVAAVGGAAVGWFGPGLFRQPDQARAESRTEAIATWCELLRDASGTSRGIEGMLVATAASAPGPIRPEVVRLAKRLQFEPLDVALNGLADDLAHPLGDLVVTALRLAATAGSRRVRLVLDDLATAAHLEAGMQRRVDVARQRPRSTMRIVAVIVGVFIAGMVVFGGDYLAPYRTPLGQLVLAAVAGYWALGFWWMHKMGQLPTVERFLAKSDGFTTAEDRPAGGDR